MSSDVINNEASTSIPNELGNDISDKPVALETNEEEQINAIRIINNINNEMQPEISTNSSITSSALAIPVVSTAKLSFANPNRIRIINSSDLVGKTLISNGNVPKVINVSSSGSGENREFIKLVSGKTIHNVHAIPVTSGGVSPAKIIRIKSENESPQKISIASLTGSNSGVKKVVTIQASNAMVKTPIQLHMHRNSVKLSPKSGISVINRSAIATNQLITSQTSSATNFILLTPATMSSFPTKSVETSSSLLRPIPSSDIKGSIYDRYESSDLNNRHNQRMETGSVSNSSTWQQYVRQYAHMGPCPICEDSISGYHYGIFCCESCKGFFKRSVQNHKDYVCHVQQSGGEPCGINKHTRKKCPSCRFQRCVDKGMRIEAVRNDRSRGGRSLYPGSRNRVQRYSFPDSQSDESQKSSVASTGGPDPSRYVSYIRQLNSTGTPLQTTAPSTLQQSTNITSTLDFSRNLSLSTNGPLHRALSSRGRTSMMSVLDNIVVIEEQLQQERDVLGPIIEDDDMAVYRVLLKLAEQRLHRMVRWSRALPEFSAIDTDDQIMLVQNCWAELLILDCCYRSLGDPREIHLTSGKCINLEAACELGAKDIVEFILRTTQKLKSLKLDVREYACLKVLLLMQPDLKQLKAEGRVRMFQETVSQLLLDHTNHNYEMEHPNKFYDLIVCVPEIRQAANSVKEMLISKDLSPFLSSNSLLLELLNCNTNLPVPITVAKFEADENPSVVVDVAKPQFLSKEVKIISISRSPTVVEDSKVKVEYLNSNVS